MQYLRRLSLNKLGTMLQKFTFTNDNWPYDKNFVFSVEPLHRFHLQSSKSLEECTEAYLYADIVMFFAGSKRSLGWLDVY